MNKTFNYHNLQLFKLRSNYVQFLFYPKILRTIDDNYNYIVPN